MPDGLDPYAVLEVGSTATQAELKASYRRLVKQHHPDAGGSEERILALNAAWEQLGDPESRRAFDTSRRPAEVARDEARARGARNARASQVARQASGRASHADEDLATWLRKVYSPIDRLLGQVINPFAAELRALSADPYDDALMEAAIRGVLDHLDPHGALFDAKTLQNFNIALNGEVVGIGVALSDGSRRIFCAWQGAVRASKGVY